MLKGQLPINETKITNETKTPKKTVILVKNVIYRYKCTSRQKIHNLENEDSLLRGFTVFIKLL